MGTRPEVIKLAPVIVALQERDGLEVVTCATAQHRGLLDEMVSFFDLSVDVDLDLMKPDQDLFDLTARTLVSLRDTLDRIDPDLVLAQGDTTTVLATSVACHYRNTPFGHVEAGLRSGSRREPFPEEMNRRVASLLADWHYAPTERARQAMLAENVPDDTILVTGNTVVDALAWARQQLGAAPARVVADESLSRFALLTTHRRESFGEPLRRTLTATRQVLDEHDDLQLVVPVHPNPHVESTVHELLADHPRIHLLPPQPYPELLRLLRDAVLVLTDSGGIQEEAPSLGTPVLVLRQHTERQEGLDSGDALLVGTDPEAIVTGARRLLQQRRRDADGTNPYGDGRAAHRIAEHVARVLGTE